jgi:hypothetical protein
LPGISIHPTQHVLREELRPAQATAKLLVGRRAPQSPEPQPDLRSIVHAELQAFANNNADGIATAISSMGRNVRDDCTALVAALEARIARLEAAEQNRKHLGTWQEGRRYKVGNDVNQGGSTFRANADNVDVKPGNGSSCWTLVAARGRDGRDAVAPAAPAAPRTPTMMRGTR